MTLPPAIPYRPDIDGLRAVAVLAVVVFHIFPEYSYGGFIGVDIFFVISGYLISGIILSALAENRFSFIDFYARRARRIFPALLIVLLFCLAFGWLGLMEDEYAHLGKHVAGSAAFISNLVLWREAGYFDVDTLVKPLMHLWSLGIEEQFYAVWPLIIFAAWKKRIRAAYVIAAIGMASFALNIWLAGTDATAAFYLPVTRLWELLLGGLLCCFQRERHNHALSVAGATCIAAGMLLIDRTLAYPGWWALLPTAGAACLIAAGNRAWVNRLLSLPPLICLGLISYPLYLWHWPLFSLARIAEAGIPSLEIRAGIVLASLLLAALTYYAIEQPLRKQAARVVALPLTIALFITAAAGFAVFRHDGFPARDIGIDRHARAAFLWEERGRNVDQRCLDRMGRDMPYCLIADYDRLPTVALFGDSHANHFFFGVADYYQQRGGNVLQIGGTAGCIAPFSGYAASQACKALTRFMIDYIRNQDSIHTVLIATKAEMKNADDFSQKLEETIDLLGSRKTVILLMEVPEIGFDPKSCLDARPFRISAYVKRDPCATPREDIFKTRGAYEAAIRKSMSRRPQLRVFNPADYLCDDSWCYAQRDGKLLYRDNNHLSYEGSLYFSDKFGF